MTLVPRSIAIALRWAVLAGCTSLAGCASAPPTPKPPPSPLPPQAGCAMASTAGALCIVVLGDSIAEGVPVVGDGRWWPRLRASLAAALPNRTVVIDNWAVSGSQIDVLESAARDQPAIGSYALAIVIEGVNDQHALPADVWRPRYEAAVANLEAKGLVVVVATPPPSFENAAFAPLYDEIAAAVRKVALGSGGGAAKIRPLLDIAARYRADGPATAAAYYVDTVHQSEAGQIVMAAMAQGVVMEAIIGAAAR